jgi:hypothetical protein
VKKSRDQGLSRVKKALDNDENPLSIWEIDFIRTSYRILDINSEEMINRIVKRAMEKGAGQAKRVMNSIRSQLDDLGKRAENHKRPTPTPAFVTRTYDDMDAPGRSLAHLQTCARGLRDATTGGFSKGIKMAKIVVENAIEDFKVTVARTADVCKWRHGVAEEWYVRGKEVCGDLLEEAGQAPKEAEAREAAEAKVRIMESECEELASLAEQAEKQAATEVEPEPLIELAEEMEQRKETMESLGQSLKETIPAEFKERAQQAVQDSVRIAEEGRRWLGHVRARLEFRSADSEAGSYRGPVGAGTAAADHWRRPLGGAPEARSGAAEDSMTTTDGLAALLWGWG